MARPLVEVELDTKKLTAILDRGARHSYIMAELAEKFTEVPVHEFEVKFAGEYLKIRAGRVVTGTVKDTDGRAYLFSAILFPVKEIGEESGKRIDILFGSIMLQAWGTVIDDSAEPPKVDFRLLREGTLIELLQR